MTADRSAGFRALLGRSLTDLVDDGVATLVASGLLWGEGPVYWPAQRRWIFSDIPNNRMLAWSHDGGLQTFRAPSNFANGSTLDVDGNLLTCEHGTRRVVRTSPRGDVGVVCDGFEGRHLNSPNDVVQHTDGSIWFSDPTYGILSDVEGYRAPSEQAANRVYRVDPTSGQATAEVSQLRMPNGLCFSPNGRRLYVADSGADMGPDVAFDPDGPRDVHAFDLDDDGRVAGVGALFAEASAGVPDGLRCDEAGYLWVATGAGLECFRADGSREGILTTPETLSNLAFGGDGGANMMLALATSAYVLTPPET